MSAGPIEFDADAHVYRVGGIIRPSVTQILGAAGIINAEWYSADAAARGSAVHAAAHYADENDLDPAWREASPYVGYLCAWEHFKADAGFVVDLVEHRVFHAGLGFAGTLDRTGTIGRTRVMLDLKTGGHEEWHPVQLAAYTACDIAPRVFRRMNVYLKGDGSYNVREYPSGEFARDFAVFSAATTIYHFNNRKKAMNGNRRASAA